MTQSIRRGGRRVGLATRCAIAIATALASIVVLSSAQAQAQAQAPAPDVLHPAGATHVVASLEASGVQIYVCKRDAANQLAWTFQAPQAELYDASGQLVVRHGAGPSWEAPDGSRITGKLLQHAANPDDAAAIPMLLLSATSAGGPGLLNTVRYVQRLATHGGAAPAQACVHEGEEGRSPYLAQYVFLE
ncbi:DUF3455 domain-containing protein [Paraburkholderia sp. UYCP14C]|uniref:DUF3455 domain-containing protein n=1 Tax=Paraburkholderia sp. UYCP14C TaxID=2511130 RepID=UPI00101EA9DB|nr:DUF3455 domain-containing protein [Paraburkholderia sp. UYCP14C]RZF26229.1 DUF3455 domain-containing protein [Paraburkholderia sp. UYCP14C]